MALTLQFVSFYSLCLIGKLGFGVTCYGKHKVNDIGTSQKENFALLIVLSAQRKQNKGKLRNRSIIEWFLSAKSC